MKLRLVFNHSHRRHYWMLDCLWMFKLEHQPTPLDHNCFLPKYTILYIIMSKLWSWKQTKPFNNLSFSPHKSLTGATVSRVSSITSLSSNIFRYNRGSIIKSCASSFNKLNARYGRVLYVRSTWSFSISKISIEFKDLCCCCCCWWWWFFFAEYLNDGRY